MINVNDVVPKVSQNLYRYEVLNSDGTGTGTYTYLKYSPDELEAVPTNVNRSLLMGIQGMANNNTTFNADGSITEVSDTGTKTTVFNADGTITETFTNSDNVSIAKKTTFNADGSITEAII